MARPYSRKILAFFIACGNDTASAANIFNKSVSFVQDEQRDPNYYYWLNYYLKQKSETPEISIDSQTTQPTESTLNFSTQLETS